MSAVLLLYGWLGIGNLGGLVVFALLYGLSSGGIVSVAPSAVMTMAPDMSRVGTRMGMTFTLTGFSALVGTPIAGWILGGGVSEEEWVQENRQEGSMRCPGTRLSVYHVRTTASTGRDNQHITVWARSLEGGLISRSVPVEPSPPTPTLFMLIWFGRKPRSAWCMGRGPSHVSGIASSSAGIRSWDGMRLKINDASKGRQGLLLVYKPARCRQITA